MKSQIDPKRLDNFISRLKAHKRKRVSIETLWKIFTRAFPGSPQGAEQYRWLSDCLQQMEQLGIIRLPSAKSRRWDRSFEIPLPRSVDCLTHDPEPPPKEWKSFPWNPLLHWVADVPYLTPKQLRFLQRVHDGLASGQFQSPAPLKYRSLQLTGDEKALGALSETRLFGPGRLNFDIIGCIPDAVPLAWESISDRPSIIVFENAGPFSVARGVLEHHPHSPYGMIAYGGGKSFLSSVQHLLTIARPVETIHYVGDIDLPGLTIAVEAGKIAQKTGLPRIAAAPGLHHAMLEAAKTFQHPNGWPAAKSKPAGMDTKVIPLLPFLPPDTQTQIRDILVKGRRIPEEVLGPDELEKAWNPGSRDQ